MRKPVFNFFWLLLCLCSIWGCGVRPGEKTPENQTQEMLSYEIGDAEVTITHCNEAADGDLEMPAEDCRAAGHQHWGSGLQELIAYLDHHSR